MRKKRIDIYKLDNYLYFFGRIFLVIGAAALLMVLFPEKKEQAAREAGSPADYGAAVFFLAGSAVMLASGRGVRRKEEKVLSLLRSLELAGEVSIDEFLTSTGYSREDVDFSLRMINRRGLGYYVLNPETGTIVDGRLRRRVVLVKTCPACGKAVGERYSLDLAEIPACPSCGTPFDVGRWNQWKLDALRSFSEGAPETGPAAGGKFSLPVFILLLVFFWPGAVAYLYFRVLKRR